MLRKIDKVLCKIQELFLSFLIIFMAAVLVGNVFARVVFHNSWSFAEEIGKFVIIFVTFIGTTIAARYGEHINMTAFVDLLKPKTRMRLLAVTNFLTALLFSLFFYYAVNYVIYTKEIQFMSPALRVPMYIVYLSLPFSFFMSAVEYFKLFYANIKGKILFEDLYKEEEADE